MVKYYKFTSGLIIKRENNLFYYLSVNKKWVLKQSIMDLFYDAESDYEEINEDTVNRIIQNENKGVSRR